MSTFRCLITNLILWLEKKRKPTNIFSYCLMWVQCLLYFSFLLCRRLWSWSWVQIEASSLRQAHLPTLTGHKVTSWRLILLDCFQEGMMALLNALPFSLLVALKWFHDFTSKTQGHDASADFLIALIMMPLIFCITTFVLTPFWWMVAKSLYSTEWGRRLEEARMYWRDVEYIVSRYLK